jgi:hypothetical protein
MSYACMYCLNMNVECYLYCLHTKVMHTTSMNFWIFFGGYLGYYQISHDAITSQTGPTNEEKWRKNH